MSHATRPDYRLLHFGAASAEQERDQEPELLLRGFYDVGNITEKLIGTSSFLVLGYKGSGKSAIGQRLKLLEHERSNLLVRDLLLSDFSFAKFAKMVSTSDATEPEAHLPGAWTWILLLQLIQSFERDEGAERDVSLLRTVSQLKKLGILPSETAQQLVLQSSKTAVKAKLGEAFALENERVYESQQPDVLDFVEPLKATVSAFRSPNQHLIIVDGLDDILTLKNLQYQVLAALVLATEKLNSFLWQSGVPAKVILLCRTDLFVRLPGPNTNKIRQDRAIELDWYHDPAEPGQSKLVALANHRAKQSDGRISDLFREFFPVSVGTRDMRAFVADHTRHTPRDFLRLLSFIQPATTDYTPGIEAVHKGIREYSKRYFLSELKNEIVGFSSPAIADDIFALLGTLRAKEFTFAQLSATAKRHPKFKDLDLDHAVSLLFDCSALGNVDRATMHFWFKYRNPQSFPNFDERFMIHQGLWRVLNLI